MGDRLFNWVNVYLAENGLKVNRGAIVDATIINASTSTKNKEKTLTRVCFKQDKGIRDILE